MNAFVDVAGTSTEPVENKLACLPKLGVGRSVADEVDRS
jgi:hypothetical protein